MDAKTFNVVISKRAQKEIIKTFEYIQQKFGKSSANKMIDKLDKVILKISVNPKMFPETSKKVSRHKCVLSKQSSIYYDVAGNQINILAFRDNRMNPKTLIL